MGQWIFDIDDTRAARAVYAQIPADMARGVELRTCLGQARLTAPTEVQASWLRKRLAIHD